MGGIQGAVESVCCVGCMRGVFQGVHKWRVGLQYVRRLLVRDWFLKWNCFFMVWARRFADFRTRWGVEAGGVGTKLRLKASTLVSVGDSW